MGRGFTSTLEAREEAQFLRKCPSQEEVQHESLRLPRPCIFSTSRRTDLNFSSESSRPRNSMDRYGVFPFSVVRCAALQIFWQAMGPGRPMARRLFMPME